MLGTALALLAHDTAALLLLGANLLMLGWWVSRRPAGFLRVWLVAQGAVVALWASWLPAFATQVRDRASSAWIPKPTVAMVRDAAYALWGGVTRGTPYVLELGVIVVLAGLGLWGWRREPRWVAFVLVFLLLTPLGELSRLYFGQGGHHGLHLVAYGVLLIAVVLFLPQGAYPYLRRFFVGSRP